MPAAISSTVVPASRFVSMGPPVAWGRARDGVAGHDLLSHHDVSRDLPRQRRRVGRRIVPMTIASDGPAESSVPAGATPVPSAVTGAVPGPGSDTRPATGWKLVGRAVLWCGVACLGSLGLSFFIGM